MSDQKKEADWQETNPQMIEEIQKRSKEFASLNEESKKQLTQIVKKYESLPKTQKEFFKKNVAEWKKLPLVKKELINQKFKNEISQLKPEEKKPLFDKFDLWESMTESQREIIRKKYPV